MKKSKKKIITIYSSADFYIAVVEVQEKLQKRGYRVKIPLTANKMKRANDFTVRKTWLTNPKDYNRKTLILFEQGGCLNLSSWSGSDHDRIFQIHRR